MGYACFDYSSNNVFYSCPYNNGANAIFVVIPCDNDYRPVSYTHLDVYKRQIVVALIDDEEATLKRLRKRGASIALEAANPAYETRIFGPDRVRIQGKLVNLVRKY